MSRGWRSALLRTQQCLHITRLHTQRHHNRMNSTASRSTTVAATPEILATSATQSVSPLKQRVYGWLDSYEDFIGVKAVKEAQAHVMKWEEKLSEAQLLRREKQAEIKNLQSRLKEIHFDLDRTSRGEDKYLVLLTEEHATIKKERELLDKFESFETAEREAFHQLSMKVRESHEKERERVEKTKWWGVTASLTGAVIGLVASSISNELRMRRLKEMLPASSDDLKVVIASAEEQQRVLRELLRSLQTSLALTPTESVEGRERGRDAVDGQQLLSTIRAENARLAAQIEELSKKIQLDKAIADPEAVVYVGSDMERLLDQTEKNLESKMKLQTLLSVVMLYSAVAFTVPFLWAVFRGG